LFEVPATVYVLAFVPVCVLAQPEVDQSNVSSHSARIGATHDLAEEGASDAAIMRDAGFPQHHATRNREREFAPIDKPVHKTL